MKLRNFLGLALCCTVLGMQAQTDVSDFVPGSTLEGVSYFLPKTAFRITIITEKTVTKPGDFYKYANRYLRLPNVPAEESVAWSIKSIKLEPFGVPDKEKAYSIKIKSKDILLCVHILYLHSSNPFFCLDNKHLQSWYFA